MLFYPQHIWAPTKIFCSEFLSNLQSLLDLCSSMGKCMSIRVGGCSIHIPVNNNTIFFIKSSCHNSLIFILRLNKPCTASLLGLILASLTNRICIAITSPLQVTTPSRNFPHFLDRVNGGAVRVENCAQEHLCQGVKSMTKKSFKYLGLEKRLHVAQSSLTPVFCCNSRARSVSWSRLAFVSFKSSPSGAMSLHIKKN